MTQVQQPDVPLTPLKRALLALEEMQNKLDAAEAAKESAVTKAAATEPVAVIGLGCRFPGGADTPAAYWDLLRRGGQATGEPPAGRAGVVAGVEGPHCAGWLHAPVDGFDPQFFGIAPREAHGMDPQQRLLLEVAWEALESACQPPDRLHGARAGVYVGVSANDYLHLYLKQDDPALFDGYYASGIAHSIAAGRLSYLLGLQGPSISVDTACSSSLAAVHLAVQSLRSGETDLALAGGVHLMLAPENFLAFRRFGMLAADGRCKTFDAAADGFGRGEGCGVVVLKRLADALAHGDRVLAVIRGSAMNQDGASSGLTAPNGPAQEAVIRAALAQAAVDPAQVGYVETHGTGTALGDPIEVQALGSVFGPAHTPERPLVLGAVKANLGHTEAAAGVAGLIKLILLLQHGEIPPQVHYRTPSPFIPWGRLPLVVPVERTPWPAGAPRIGGVSAFGFSGTNVHVVVEAPPAPLQDGQQPDAAERPADAAERPLHLLALSAKGPGALVELAARYAAALEAPGDLPSLPDVCYSANAGRAHFAQRLTVVAASTAKVVQKLHAFAAGADAPGLAAADAERSAPPRIAFLFTGQGAQYAGMGRELHRTQRAFRAAFDRCADLLRSHLPVPLLEIIDPPPGAPAYLDDTTYAQPALFAIEYALAQLWQAWGVTPNFVLGHSVGEYVAAVLAGVFSLEDGLALIAARGRLMGSLPPGGAMTAIFADEATVAAAVAPFAASVSIAAINGPDNTVISGRRAEVEAVVAALQAQGVKARPLKVSHAFHSPLMEPALGPLAQVAAAVTYHPPRLRLVSDVTGEVASGGLVSNAAYWRDHARLPVRFAAGVETLRRQGVDIFLEIGPGSTLIGMGERCLAEREGAEDEAAGQESAGQESAGQEAGPPLWLASLKPSRGEWATMLDSTAALYRAGVTIDWEGFDRGDTPRRRLDLPTYPFQRGRYWLPSRAPQANHVSSISPRHLVTSSPPHPLTLSPRRPPVGHPLLGRRLPSPLPGVQYEVELDAAALAYLDDHRVGGAAVLPGAAIMEAALAIGRQLALGAGLAVHDLLLLEMLSVPDGAARTVQWIATPQEGGGWRFQCFSRGAEAGAQAEAGEWRLHASASLAPADAAIALDALDLAALRAALPTPIDAGAHYAALDASGLVFGPSLHGVAEIWCKEGEALGRIVPSAAVQADAGAYGLHPALLDAHLQVLAAAMPPRAGVYLPFSLDRLHVLRPGVQPAWSHVVLAGGASDAPAAAVRASVRLLDAQGAVVALLDGLSLKRLEARLPGEPSAGSEAADLADWLYEVAWEPRPLALPAAAYQDALTGHNVRLFGAPELSPNQDTLAGASVQWPPLPALAGELARQLEQLEEEHDLPTYALDVAPQLDRLSLAYIVRALAELGWQPQPGDRFTEDELAQALGIAPRHRRLLGRLCAILAEDGILAAGDEGAAGVRWQVCAALPSLDVAGIERSLRQRHPAYGAEIELVARCGSQLAAALVGRVDPVHLLFPQGDLSTTEALYRESPSARVYNGLLRSAVQRLAAGRTAPLRVLEIGGGTGGTTAHLLPVLPAEQTTYLFTDISPLFVARAEEKFGRFPAARFAVLDLEKDPASQGLADRQFDLVVAANVVHATADLRESLRRIGRLLAPGGVLVLLEVTGAQRWVDVTFGLTAGWWRFTDADLRPTYPLLSIAQWRDLLAGCGFDSVTAAPGEDGAGFIDEALILARRTPAEAAANVGHACSVTDGREPGHEPVRASDPRHAASVTYAGADAAANVGHTCSVTDGREPGHEPDHASDPRHAASVTYAGADAAANVGHACSVTDGREPGHEPDRASDPRHAASVTYAGADAAANVGHACSVTDGREPGHEPDRASDPRHAASVTYAGGGAPATLGHWLLLADCGGVGERLGQALASRGAQVTLAFATPEPPALPAPLGAGGLLLDPLQPEGFHRLLAGLPGESLAGVVHLWSLDAPTGDIGPETLAAAVATANAGALHLVQALAAAPGEATPRLWFATRGAEAVQPEDAAGAVTGDPASPAPLPGVAQSPLWGLVQAVTLEHPEWQPALVDLDPSDAGEDACLLAELLAPDGEDRTAWRGGQRYAARLAASRLAATFPADAPLLADAPADGAPVQLEVVERGTLGGLALRPLARRTPGPGEVEIRTAAIGLNFKDVLKTLGMVPGDDGPLGGECAGEITAVGEGVTGLHVGERVLAIAAGSMRTHVIARAELVAPLPAGMSDAEGASIPIAFVTAAYTLQHVAGLRPGERVLIHAAAGGVGLAAVQIAQRLGAEVLATAGSESKRAYLRGLGVAHVFDSRSLSFVAGVREATGGRGVDVVLNSLAGPFIGASLDLLAPGGRFVEIGKSGLLTPQEAAALREGRQYFAVDWTPDALTNPLLIRGLLDGVLAALAAGELMPLPRRTYALAEAEAAFRHMAQAQHIGKIVLLAGGAPAAGGITRPDRSYLVTGGLRGLGLLTAGWLAEQGAGALALVGRSAPGVEERAAIARIEAGGCRVLVLAADIAERAAVERVLATVAAELPPLAGIVHAAGVLDDGVLMGQSWPRVAGVLAPKVQGAWHLHQGTRDLPLDFFVLYSSLAALFGSAGQGNHAAANAFLDALAHYRRGQGLPATSINWGIWSEVGIAARLAAGRATGAAPAGGQGLGTISPQAGLRLLEAILRQEPGRQPVQIGVTPVAWPRYARSFAGAARPFFARFAAVAGRPSASAPAGNGSAGSQGGGDTRPAEGAPVQQRKAAEPALIQELAALPAAKRRTRLIDLIKAQTGQVLGLDPQACSERAPLSEMGLDSLMAVELRNLLSARLGLKRPLPATLVFDYPSIGAMADYLLAGVLASSVAGEAPAPQPGSLSSLPAASPAAQDVAAGGVLLADLESLSDEEVERRLAYL